MAQVPSPAASPHSAVVHLDGRGVPQLVRHPDSGRILAFAAGGDAFRFSVALGLAGFRAAGSIAAPAGAPLHPVGRDDDADALVRELAGGTAWAVADDDRVLAVLRAAGARGASHEDFVDVGLGSRYAAALRRLVEVRGCTVTVDFTTGAARWALARDRAEPGLVAAA